MEDFDFLKPAPSARNTLGLKGSRETFTPARPAAQRGTARTNQAEPHRRRCSQEGGREGGREGGDGERELPTLPRPGMRAQSGPRLVEAPLLASCHRERTTRPKTSVPSSTKAE